MREAQIFYKSSFLRELNYKLKISFLTDFKAEII
jgi:hypothetical protein